MVSTGLLQRMRGFTLIEIAVVLVVIGLLLSGGLLAIAPVLEQTKITETRDKLDRIEDALILHAIQFSCLPCPTDGTLTTGTGNAGIALDSATAVPVNGCAANASCRANGGDNVVPWATLGLSEADVLDGWGNRIYYDVSDALEQTGNMNRNGTTYPTGDLTVCNIADRAPLKIPGILCPSVVESV